MLRMGKLTDYATVVLASLAQEPTRHRAAAELAERTRLSRPTVSKVLKGLQRAGMVISSRGAQGGYRLARDPEQITAAQILDIFEGPIAITECSGASSHCGIERQCRVGAAWQRVNAAIRRALEEVTLRQLAGLDSSSLRVADLASEIRVDQLEIRVSSKSQDVEALLAQKYRHGFVTDIESDSLPPGLDEDVVAAISKKKHEPQFLLDWRLKAFRHWLTMQEPTWAHVHYKPIDYQDISYYSAPRAPANAPKSLDEVDPKLLATYAKLGIPLHERARLAGVAVDAVFDSVSVATTFKEKLGKAGVIFCSFSDAVRDHPGLIERYLGSVVPPGDNFFAALNSAVFSDGSFVYVPPGVRCPMELSTYFRINAAKTGQFERTLIIAAEAASVSYLEGCTAPMRDENQLHAAVVELVALDDAQIKYSTVQNWYPGDENGLGGIYNFVTKRGECRGHNSKISWTQVETGSAITWKYPSCILKGDNSIGEFYSVAVANNYQQADTGTKMIHIGRNTRSTIVSKGISAGHAENTYRGLVKILPSAAGARNFTQCDSLLMGPKCAAHTFPYMEVKNPTATVEHEASTSKIGEDQLFYCLQRGISAEDAVNMIVSGFCKVVFKELPMEFAVEAQNLLSVSLEGAVG